MSAETYPMIVVGLPRTYLEDAKTSLERVPRPDNERQYGGNAHLVVVGRVAELAIAEWLGAELVDKFSHDLEWRGARVECKAIQCSSPPLPHYTTGINGRVDGQENRQDADLYVFSRLWRSERRLFITAWEYCSDWWAKAKHVPMGSSLFPGGGEYKAKRHDAWTVPIQECRAPETIFDAIPIWTPLDAALPR